MTRTRTRLHARGLRRGRRARRDRRCPQLPVHGAAAVRAGERPVLLRTRRGARWAGRTGSHRAIRRGRRLVGQRQVVAAASGVDRRAAPQRGPRQRRVDHVDVDARGAAARRARRTHRADVWRQCGRPAPRPRGGPARHSTSPFDRRCRAVPAPGSPSSSISSRSSSRCVATMTSGSGSSTRSSTLRLRPTVRTMVVVALRADFFGHCAVHDGFARLLESQSLLVGAMGEVELARGDRGTGTGRRVCPSSPGWPTSSCVTSRVSRSGLPLLSHALSEVWARREGRTLTLDGYRASGGVTGVDRPHRRRGVRVVRRRHQRVARGVFLRLTELGEGTEDTRRRPTLEELSSDDPEEAARTETVIATLAAARLDHGVRGLDRGRARGADPRMAAPARLAGRGPRRAARDAPPHPRGARTGPSGAATTASCIAARSGRRRSNGAAGARGRPQPARARVPRRGRGGARRAGAHAGRATRRLRALLAGTGVALVIALVAGILALNQRNRANTERDRTGGRRERRDRAAPGGAVRMMQDTSLDLSLLLAVEANLRDDSTETRGTLQSALLSNPELLGFLRGTASGYKSVAISQSGVIAGGGARTASSTCGGPPTAP